MEQKIIDLFDRYTHGGMTGATSWSDWTSLAGSAAAATALLPILENNYALAEIVPGKRP